MVLLGFTLQELVVLLGITAAWLIALTCMVVGAVALTRMARARMQSREHLPAHDRPGARG